VVPGVAQGLAKAGIELVVEAGAGDRAGFGDAQYQEKGALLATRADVLARATLLLSVRSFAGAHDKDALDSLDSRHVLVGLLDPLQQPEGVRAIAARGLTAFALELVPRISRAQSMDALSSTATMVGYKAVLLAAERLPRMMPMLMTAAGTVAPARLLVIGAGVAGLQAIATARRLGAVVEAYDVRPAVKEQVQSLGAKFVELPLDASAAEDRGGYARAQDEAFYRRQRELLARVVADSDVVIAAAAVPGKKAPVLVTSEMLRGMRPGSLLVDLAAEQGGNCAGTEAGKVVQKHCVTLIGYTDLPSRLPTQSSQLYATNLRHLLTDLCPDKNGQINVNLEDEVIRGATVIKNGEITWPPPAPKLSAKPAAAKAAEPAAPVAKPEPKKSGAWALLLPFLLGGAALFGLGRVAPPSFMAHFTVFVLACFVGYMVIWNVTPALHTPLMSVTNAISSIIIIGALLQVSSDVTWIKWLAAAAILITAVNIAGGFAVTQRMLQMFRK
jgi:NAD(P) transhydrogenase subunit alpha